MKKFNEKLNKDITLLKALHSKRDKTEFMKMRNIVIKRHKINKCTVYRQMKRAIPGLPITARKNYKPITNEEMNMVSELLFKQFRIAEIRAALERLTGFGYSNERINKIRKEAEKRSNQPEDTEHTAFGGNIRKLFIELCNFDLTELNRVQKLLLNGKEIKINCGVIRDAVDMLIFSAENEGKSTAAIHRQKMENMLSRKLELVSQGQYIAAYDLRILENIRQSLEKQGAVTFSPDYKVLAEVCRELKPGISDVQIFFIADKHQRLIKESSEDIVPFRAEVRRLAAKEAEENM